MSVKREVVSGEDSRLSPEPMDVEDEKPLPPSRPRTYSEGVDILELRYVCGMAQAFFGGHFRVIKDSDGLQGYYRCAHGFDLVLRDRQAKLKEVIFAFKALYMSIDDLVGGSFLSFLHSCKGLLERNSVMTVQHGQLFDSQVSLRITQSWCLLCCCGHLLQFMRCLKMMI